jgi:hypothetical protein
VSADNRPLEVVFVCTGNQFRSPFPTPRQRGIMAEIDGLTTRLARALFV